MTTQASADGTTERVALERRFEDFGWGVLLIAVGTIWLLPEKHVPHGSWLIATSLIMLGLNAARFFSGLRTSGFSLVVGILALIAGLGEFFGIGVPLLPIALIVIGAYILLRPLRHKDSASATGHRWSCCGPRAAGE
jgi:hypothetical protein